jgi:hypothetical protein
MKNIKLSIMALALAGLALLSSCGGDKEAVPTVTIVTPSSNTGTHVKGEKIDFTVSVTSENNLTSVTAYADNKEITTKTSGFTEKKSDDFTFSYTVEEGGKTILIEVTAIDKFDNKSTATYAITSLPSITSYSAKLLGAQLNDAGSYFASVNGTVYLGGQRNDNADKIDITFAQIGATFTPELISPDTRGDRGLTTTIINGTATSFKLSTLDFNGATAQQMNDISASGAVKFIAIETGKVYQFVNSKGKKGLVKVASYNPGTTGSANGSVTIDVKVQE